MKFRTVTLAQIVAAGFDESNVRGGTTPLDPARIPEINRQAKTTIVVDAKNRVIDGYHRVQGAILWAREHGVPFDSITIPVMDYPDDMPNPFDLEPDED